MKVLYVEGIAGHNGPESCGASCKGGVEALTGERAGWVLNREISSLMRKQQALRGADALDLSGRQYQGHRHCKVRLGPARSETPGMHGNILYGNREIPRLSAGESLADRVGKPRGIRR